MTTEPISEIDVMSARTTLDQLMASVGVDGLVAAMRSPGLLSLVDQHAAAVRETLAAAGRGIDAISLARYARSVGAVASRHGYPPPDVATLDWRDADWYLLRLVAVCALAEAADCL